MTSAFAEIDAACAAFAQQHQLPGLAAGIVQNGVLAHTVTVGVADIEAGLCGAELGQQAALGAPPQFEGVDVGDQPRDRWRRRHICRRRRLIARQLPKFERGTERGLLLLGGRGLGLLLLCEYRSAAELCHFL